MRADGAIRIGLSAVDAAWRGRPPVSRPIAAADASPSDAMIGAALGHVLDAAPRRRFFSPHLRIMIADPHIHMAVLRFQHLPRARADLDLLVTQRFCRDHRIEPAGVAISFALLGETPGGHHILVCAVNAGLAAAIRQNCAVRDLAPDIIAAESAFAIRALQGLAASVFPLLLLLHDDYATIVLWQQPHVIGHIAVVRQHDRPRAAFLGAVTARIERYATLARAGEGRPAVHVLGCGGGDGEADILRGLPHPVRDLRREPGLAEVLAPGRPAWTAMMEHGG